MTLMNHRCPVCGAPIPANRRPQVCQHCGEVSATLERAECRVPPRLFDELLLWREHTRRMTTCHPEGARPHLIWTEGHRQYAILPMEE